MSRIFVCPLSALDETLATSGAKTMIAFGGPEAELDQPVQIKRQLGLRFNDIGECREGLQEPTKDHVAQIIAVADEWDQATPLLLQCWMGISRSTAAAAIIALRMRPDIEPSVVAHAIRQMSPMATPNPLMIVHADRLLGLGGRFNSAIADIGRGETAAQGIPFSLDIRRL